MNKNEGNPFKPDIIKKRAIATGENQEVLYDVDVTSKAQEKILKEVAKEAKVDLDIFPVSDKNRVITPE